MELLSSNMARFSGHGCTLLLPPQLNTGELLSGGGPEARDLGSGPVDCMRPHLADMIDLLHDPNLLNKIKGSVSKSIVNRNLICLNEDTLGAIVKGGIAQYVAMELALEQSRGKQDRGPTRHMMPWLTTTLPGSRDVAECVGRVRLVSWVVLGALSNARTHPLQLPVPLDATCHLTDHIQLRLKAEVGMGRAHSSENRWTLGFECAGMAQVDAAWIAPQRGGQTTSNESPGAAGNERPKTVDFGTPYERSMSSRGPQ
ncbi:jg14474 [Pararge aegeria aegeria]|uniref:Jg14474 protein n=1 Tax=Pararge aegeria aegeria TaxID=348720 RepID=A0A8S4RYJ8_9NEOP|nr:jg14474 [Pararge aegeria aegeria]